MQRLCVALLTARDGHDGDEPKVEQFICPNMSDRTGRSCRPYHCRATEYSASQASGKHPTADRHVCARPVHYIDDVWHASWRIVPSGEDAAPEGIDSFPFVWWRMLYGVGTVDPIIAVRRKQRTPVAGVANEPTAGAESRVLYRREYRRYPRAGTPPLAGLPGGSGTRSLRGGGRNMPTNSSR